LDETTTVNLAHHIGPDTNDETAIKEHLNAFKVDPRRRDPMAYPKMYLPPQYNTNDKTTRKQVIIPLISNAFNVDGGGGVSKGWEPPQQKIIFQCSRGRVAKSQKKGGNDPAASTKSMNTTTARPTCNADTCNFSFSLYWESAGTTGRWYFYQNGPGCRFHSGHI
jgi:hypothetical protein